MGVVLGEDGGKHFGWGWAPAVPVDVVDLRHAS
jgi:hypothetical protein